MLKIEEVINHFRQKDLILTEELNKMELKVFVPNSNPETYFAKLCQDIVAQQLGMKAADAIIKRFLDLFPEKNPTPELVLALPESAYREIGTSWAKARYLRALAEAVQNKVVDFKNFSKLNDEEIIEELVKVKGIGRWTAEMFLIFTLGRPNVFSLGDLGLKKALTSFYGPEILEKEKLLKKLESWSPYQSYACLALWHSLNNR